MNQKGFSLVEIMVAIVLIATILLGLPTGNPVSDSRNMNDGIDKLDRAVRFSAGEAVLRNSLVRIKFNLDVIPQDFIVEYATNAKLTLSRSKDLSKMTLLDRQKEEAKEKKFNQNFSTSLDFSERPIALEQGIQIEGVVTSYLNEIIRTGEVSIYFYPTGERDNAAIFFSSYSEVGMLTVASFETDTKTDFLPLEESSEAAYDNNRDKKIEELYQLWLEE